MLQYKRIISYLSVIYILSLCLHYWEINSLRFSEIIFLLLFAVFIYGVLKNYFILKITKHDLVACSFLIINIIIILINFNIEAFLGTTFAFYLFLIYYIFRNIIETYNYNLILNSILTLTLISSILGILGWFLYQINIENIFANQRNYPFSIGKAVQASALYVSPNLLTFSLIIGIIFLIKSKIIKNIKIILFLIFNIALFFTFSKSILIYLGIILLLYSTIINNNIFKKILIFSSVFFFIIQILLSNFLILDKTKEYLWLDEKYTHSQIEPLYQNTKYKIIKTNYYFLKEKSFFIIKENFYSGIGYENFRKTNNLYPLLYDQKPHSLYFGVFSEFGFFGLISIIIIFSYNLKISLKNKNNYLYLLMIYLIIEGINTDILSLKLTWIIFSINIFLHNKKNIK